MQSFIQRPSTRFVFILSTLAIIIFLAVSCAQMSQPKKPSVDPALAMVIPATLLESPSVSVEPVAPKPAIKTITDEQEIKSDRSARTAGNDSLLDSLIHPFAYEALKRREDRARNDPDFA